MESRRARRGPRRRMTLGSMLAVAAVAVAGTASAFWAAYGVGDGSAGTGTAAVVTLGPATLTADLYPGGSADVGVTISNSGTATVHIGALALDTTEGTLGFATDVSHPDCDVSALGFTTATNGGAGWTVPGAVGGTPGSESATLSNGISMSLDAAQECQGAEFTVYLSAIQ